MPICFIVEVSLTLHYAIGLSLVEVGLLKSALLVFQYLRIIPFFKADSSFRANKDFGLKFISSIIIPLFKILAFGAYLVRNNHFCAVIIQP